MPRYGVMTKKSPEEVIREAVAFFGKGGVGLDVIDHSQCCARFAGGGGRVSVTVTEGDRTEVELVTREWDYEVKRFMRELG